ncbi:MAG: DUF4038 domain-containing protein [Acidobacteria bacterium]|nr:DUF4038 domain-containing protein [Acidobacteriota bacterium]
MDHGPHPGRRHAAASPGAVRAALLLGLALPLAAGPVSDVPIYGRFGQGVHARRAYADPLRDVQARVEFTAPSGSRHTVLAYWSGGSTWSVNFSPDRKGNWAYKWFSNDPELDRLAGSFQVVANPGKTELDRHGPPRLSPDRRHFVHADGKPWFWLADTAWNGALLADQFEWDEYLKTRAAQRFTAVQFVITQWRAGRADEKGRAAFRVENGRLSIDPEFFLRMDHFVQAVRRHGLAPVPVMLWALTSKDGESPGETLSTAQAIELARYINARYAAYGSMWLLGGDGDYRGDKANRWKEIGRAVFPPGLDRRPVSLHPRGMQDPWPGLLDEPWLDFLVYQSGHGDNEAKWRWHREHGLAEGWKYEPPRPVIDGEPDYEGHIAYHSRQVINDATVRRAVYSSLFAAPPAGVTYGAHGVWFWARKPVIPLDHAATGVAQPWKECLAYPGAAQMKLMRDLFDRVAWWTLRPDGSLTAASDSPVQALRSRDGRVALIYVPGGAAVQLALSGFGAVARAEWLNPRTGESIKADRAALAGDGGLRPPSPEDWLLLLDRAER